ncbi:MAG: hypothetical protein HC859_00660 [Bacteroidia bacterium]|nr:hypothetical protein [Bacteroidia bacterium]
MPETTNTVYFENDAFPITAVEPWFKVKVQVVTHYIRSFIAQAAAVADELVLVDLFAASGLYSVGYQRQIFASAMLGLMREPLPVSRWVFCEAQPELAAALKVRINRYFRDKNVLLFEQKPEELIDRLRFYIPKNKAGHKVAVLALADPFSLEPPYETLEKLATLGFSFLIPYTLPLNSRMGYEQYLHEQQPRLKRFIGNNYGLERLKESSSQWHFYKRLVNVHQNNMLVLGLNPALSVHKLDSEWMDVPQYYIGFYGRQIAAKSVLRDVNASAAPQISLFQSPSL